MSQSPCENHSIHGYCQMICQRQTQTRRNWLDERASASCVTALETNQWQQNGRIYQNLNTKSFRNQILQVEATLGWGLSEGIATGGGHEVKAVNLNNGNYNNNLKNMNNVHFCSSLNSKICFLNTQRGSSLGIVTHIVPAMQKST